MAADPFEASRPGLTSPASRGAAVTPSDAADLTTAARALYVGGAGDVTLDTTGGDTLTFASVPAGMWLPVRTARVRATGTTASDIVAVW